MILAVYYGVVGLAVASLTGRRAFAIGGYLLLLVAPTVLSGLLLEAFPDAEWLNLIALSTLPIGFAGELFPDARADIPGELWQYLVAFVVVVGVASLVLLRRYRPGAEA